MSHLDVIKAAFRLNAGWYQTNLQIVTVRLDKNVHSGYWDWKIWMDFMLITAQINTYLEYINTCKLKNTFTHKMNNNNRTKYFA